MAAGDTVQLDHDYCSSLSEVATSQVSFYNCDSREYKSETEPSPAPLAEGAQRKHWEKNSKKDSGLESGEVSDASDETAPPTQSAVEVPVCWINFIVESKCQFLLLIAAYKEKIESARVPQSKGGAGAAQGKQRQRVVQRCFLVHVKSSAALVPGGSNAQARNALRRGADPGEGWKQRLTDWKVTFVFLFFAECNVKIVSLLGLVELPTNPVNTALTQVNFTADLRLAHHPVPHPTAERLLDPKGGREDRLLPHLPLLLGKVL